MLSLCLQEREALLSFVIVGGGPTGVEVAAELHDMVLDDLRKIYPELVKLVKIRLIELQDHVLSTYDREISKYTASEFSRCVQGGAPNFHSFTCRVYVSRSLTP